MDLAYELNRPSCQDTGVLQFWVKVGSNYPLIGELEEILRNATYQATQDAPLRHNCVETFDEFNTGKKYWSHCTLHYMGISYLIVMM